MLACSNQVKLYLRQRISGTLNFVHTRRRDSIFCIKWRQDLVIFGQEKNKVVCRLDFWIFLKHQNDSKFEVTAYGKYMHQLIEVFQKIWEQFFHYFCITYIIFNTGLIRRVAWSVIVHRILLDVARPRKGSTCMINLTFISDLSIHCDFYELLSPNTKSGEFEKVNNYTGNPIYRISIVFPYIFIEIGKNTKIIYF